MTALRHSLPLHVALAAITGATCTAIWATADNGFFWPVWVWLPAVLGVAAHVLALRVLVLPAGPRRRVVAHALTDALLTVLLVAVWGLAGSRYPWPVWPVLGLAAPLAVHAALEFLGPGRSSRELVVGPGAVEKHVSNILAKLGLPAAPDDHRRVLAVLAHLRAT